jgi:hypothetical protein
MNRCLDYVEHIIFSSPAASFSAGGADYADYASARAAFPNPDPDPNPDLGVRGLPLARGAAHRP